MIYEPLDPPLLFYSIPTGLFVPKPDSPCLYQPLNSGPDGCAIFVRSSKFRILKHQSKVLEVWGVKSNQVSGP